MTGIKNKCLGLFDFDAIGDQTMATPQWCRRDSLHGYDDDRSIHVHAKVDRLVTHLVKIDSNFRVKHSPCVAQEHIPNQLEFPS